MQCTASPASRTETVVQHNSKSRINVVWCVYMLPKKKGSTWDNCADKFFHVMTIAHYSNLNRSTTSNVLERKGIPSSCPRSHPDNGHNAVSLYQPVLAPCSSCAVTPSIRRSECAATLVDSSCRTKFEIRQITNTCICQETAQRCAGVPLRTTARPVASATPATTLRGPRDPVDLRHTCGPLNRYLSSQRYRLLVLCYVLEQAR